MPIFKIMTMSAALFLMTCENVYSGDVQNQKTAEGVKETSIKNIYQLSDFGASGNLKAAQETFKNAAAKIIAAGGGTLFINSETCREFLPESITQEKLGAKSVTIIDLRDGKYRFVLPSLGYRIPDNPFGYASMYMDREINQRAININGDNTILRMANRLISGSVSYFQPISKFEKLSDAETMKIYPLSIKGLYVGMEIFALMGEEKISYGERAASSSVTVRVEKIEWDKKDGLYYLIARKLDSKIPWAKITHLINKASASCMTIYDISNCDVEEASTLQVEKMAFGQGDNFGVGMRFGYMGNIMSTGGDENGNGYTVDTWHLLFSFNGKVESWDPVNRKLVYTVDSDRVNTIGTSRPIINLNQSKWITQGKVAIEANWSENGEIDPKGYVRGIGTNWNSDIIGRAIAIDTPEEYCGNPPEGFWKGALKGRIIRRWWIITHYEKTSSGEDRLWIERVRHLVYDKAVPTLINEKSYRKELPYIIAPCAMVSDVSEALLKQNKVDLKGEDARATKSDKRTIVVLPSPDNGTTRDFAPGDAIEQAVGSDPSHPNGYRVRHREAMPSCNNNSSSFYSMNNGAYPIGAALAVHGGHDKMQVADHSKYFHAINVTATCDYGIRFTNTVKKAVLFMEKPEHKITWKTAAGNVSLSASPAGSMNIEGKGISLSAQPMKGVKSISAGNSFGNNLRGINIPVDNGRKEIKITFKEKEPDAEYSLTIQPSWFTRCAVSAKNNDGFTVLFDTPAPADAKIDWQLIR